jgi:hypothetical protein
VAILKAVHLGSADFNTLEFTARASLPREHLLDRGLYKEIQKSAERANMASDTSVKKVSAKSSPRGDDKQKYLVSGKLVALRRWENDYPRTQR